MDRIKIFGTYMDVATVCETVEEIKASIQAGDFIQHVVVNVAKLVNMRRNPELKESIEQCNIVNIDGMGVVWAARFLGCNIPERVAGVDLFERLIEMSAEEAFPVFLLGAKPEVVEAVYSKLKMLYPGLIVAGYHHGYFWANEENTVEMIRKSGAKLLFVAITSPKKENFINKWKDQLGVNFVMGVGGTFDVFCGKVKRAPVWMQRYGLEWMYRVYQEPRRMWKRYLVTNLVFLFWVLTEKIKQLFKKTVSLTKV